MDSEGNRRIDDSGDFVRIEIASALRRNIPLIPLLVQGATMPGNDDLPEQIRNLSFRNGIQVRPDPDFHKDMERLINAIEMMYEHPSGL